MMDFSQITGVVRKDAAGMGERALRACADIFVAGAKALAFALLWAFCIALLLMWQAYRLIDRNGR